MVLSFNDNAYQVAAYGVAIDFDSQPHFSQAHATGSDKSQLGRGSREHSRLMMSCFSCLFWSNRSELRFWGLFGIPMVLVYLF